MDRVFSDTNGSKDKEKESRYHLEMKRTKNIKQMRSFIGSINFHQYMWPGHSHILQPLSGEVGKK